MLKIRDIANPLYENCYLVPSSCGIAFKSVKSTDTPLGDLRVSSEDLSSVKTGSAKGAKRSSDLSRLFVSGADNEFEDMMSYTNQMYGSSDN